MEDPNVMDGAGSPLPTTSQTPVPKACDACRARKIRCNRESPCAHCLHAKIECTHSEGRPKEKRTRILLSHQYEKKIDLIDRRLDGVLRLLEEIKIQLPSPSSQPAEATSSARFASSSPASHVSHAETVGTVVEGESSLTAHSVFANNLLHKVVSRDSRPEMREGIDALRHAVEAMRTQPATHEMTYPHARATRQVVPEGCELPPIGKTLEMLKLARSSKQPSLSWVSDLFGMSNFPEICLSAYITDEYQASRFITASVILHYLFLTYGNVLPDKREEYLELARTCGVNLETALASLPLHLPASEETITALSLGAFYAVELAKPSLAWILSSKASELCQALGYHRSETFTTETLDEAGRKQFLFWVVYMLDKSLSLRLGRSPTIQEYDITVPDPARDGPGQTAITPVFALWVFTSRIQGQIYEQLYSPRAIAQPNSVRQARVQMLLDHLSEYDALTDETMATWATLSREAAGDDMTDFFIRSDHVLRLSIRTLILRAVPNPIGSPTTFTEGCIQAARATLARHQDCMAIVERSSAGLLLYSIYMNWTILFAPFVPFIVLFCQVIETGDRTDLDRLGGFITSLQPHNTISEAVDKLCRLFQALYSVASQYVQSHAGAGEDDPQQSKEVDAWLAAMGFPSQIGQEQPESAHLANDAGGQAFQRGINPMIWMGNGIQLEDWLYNNEQMMAFLEDGFPEGGA
ncbi:hypothetical protein VTI74DRAFT_4151 [Chaetomium olivicolor]